MKQSRVKKLKPVRPRKMRRQMQKRRLMPLQRSQQMLLSHMLLELLLECHWITLSRSKQRMLRPRCLRHSIINSNSRSTITQYHNWIRWINLIKWTRYYFSNKWSIKCNIDNLIIIPINKTDLVIKIIKIGKRINPTKPKTMTLTRMIRANRVLDLARPSQKSTMRTSWNSNWSSSRNCIKTKMAVMKAWRMRIRR